MKRYRITAIIYLLYRKQCYHHHHHQKTNEKTTKTTYSTWCIILDTKKWYEMILGSLLEGSKRFIANLFRHMEAEEEEKWISKIYNRQ